jgi:hypothetical protein
MTVAGWKFQIIPPLGGMLMANSAWIDREAACLLGIPASVFANLYFVHIPGRPTRGQARAFIRSDSISAALVRLLVDSCR